MRVFFFFQHLKFKGTLYPYLVYSKCTSEFVWLLQRSSIVSWRCFACILLLLLLKWSNPETIYERTLLYCTRGSYVWSPLSFSFHFLFNDECYVFKLYEQKSNVIAPLLHCVIFSSPFWMFLQLKQSYNWCNAQFQRNYLSFSFHVML